MFTKLYPTANPDTITFFTDKSDALRYLLANVDSGKQDDFRAAAAKLYAFAARLGLDNVKLATSIRMTNEKRCVTIQRVTRNQYLIAYKRDGLVDTERFNGTERELRRHLHELRLAGKRPIRTELELELEAGYKFGSAAVVGKKSPYTFGTVWATKIEGQPHLISRMLKTLLHYESAVSSAKDDLLEITCGKLAGAAA